MVFVVVGLVIALAAVLWRLVVSMARAAALRRRFAAIIDVDLEVEQRRAAAVQQLEQLKHAAEHDVMLLQQDGQRHQHEAQVAMARAYAEEGRLRAAAAEQAETVRRTLQAEREQHVKLAGDTAEARRQFDRLSDELRKVEGALDDISFGLYRPQYKFDTPEQFKAEMDRVYDRQKEMVRAGRAASFAVSWTIGNSKRDGERMQKQYCKLLLRAFNGECDAAIAKVTWNNATRMEERIKKAFDAVNQLGEVMTVTLAPGYRELKLAELRLEYELAENKREIADEQRRIREQMRDDERALREAETAQVEAEAEETRFQKALDRAKLELAKTRGEEHVRLNEKLAALESQLAEAHARSIRARSLAEMTKAGYVYIISNIGSFGEHVFKIGMTRRLEPMDRVRELGDASVPFPFDVHAMVYSDDAPALETAFHQRFRDRGVNLVNARKEFFHVDLGELETFAKQRGLAVSVTKLAEAREYRESVAMRLARGSGPTTLPPSLDRPIAMAGALAKPLAKARDRAAETVSSANQAKLS